MELWQPGSAKYEQCRKACMAHNNSAYYRVAVAVRSDTAIANIAITLIFQADAMLRGLIENGRALYLPKSRYSAFSPRRSTRCCANARWKG